MVIAFASWSCSLGTSPVQGHCVVFLGQTLYSHSASLHPGVEMGPGKFTGWGLACNGPPSHPGGSRNTPSRFILLKPEISTGLIGHLACMQTLSFFLINQGALSKCLAPVVRKVDNAIQRINDYPVVSVVCFVNSLIRWIVIYPVDSIIQPLNNRGPGLQDIIIFYL